MRSSLPRAETLAVVVVLALMAALYLNVSAGNPPGFNRDKAAAAYNAYTLSSTGKDEYGAHLPLFIRSLNDWKSPLYIYSLAAVFRVTGPSTAVARTFSAVLGLGAVLVMYLLALAISRRRWLALGVALLAGLTPWLFETSRIVMEVSLLPLLIALLLLVVHRASTGVWLLRHSVAIGLLLAAIAFTYSVGRVLAPLFAIGLVLCWFRRWRLLAVVWVVFLAAAVVPIGVWTLHHPGEFQARYDETAWIVPGMSVWEIVWQYLRHYVDNLNLWAWAAHGDPDSVDHVQGDGSIFFVEAALAIGGIAVVLWRRRADPWWRFMLFALLISPIAASATVETLSNRPLVLLAVMLPLFAIPALETIAALPARKARAVVVALLFVFALEAAHWQVDYWQNGPKRLGAFDAGSAALIKTALRANTELYAFREDHPAYIEMLLDGAIAGRPLSSTVVLGFGERPPAGAHVLLSWVACPQCPPVLTGRNTATAEYTYEPAKPGIVRTSFQLTSPVRAIGSPIDFAVWIKNTDATVADHLMLKVRLPPTMHLTGRPFSELGPGCTDASTIVCNIGWFPGNATTVVRYEVVVDQGGPQTMRASISTDELNVNTGPESGSAFTVDLDPPAYARASSSSG